LIENAQRWPTPSVVPLIENAPRLANPFGCPDQSKPTPLRLCLWSRCIALANPLFGCALDQKCTALANPPSVVPSIESAPRPADSATILAPCQPSRLCCQLLQLCLPAITAVPPSFWGRCDRPGRSAWPVFGFTCQPFRLCLPTISVVLPAIIAGLASYCSCAHLSRTVAGPLRMMTGTYHLITPGLSIECMRSPFGAPLRFAHSHTPALATVLP
jgi:hypothetical protein